MKKAVLISCLLFIFSGTCFAETIDSIVAVVNDQTVTASEVNDAMKPVEQQITRAYSGKVAEQKLSEARKDVLDRLIEEKLILQEAKQQKIEVKNEEVDDVIKQVKSRFPNEAAFQDAIKAQGMNMWELKKAYKEQLIVKKMVRQYVRARANITPAEITKYYEANISKYKMPPGISISQILIKYKPTEDAARTEKTAAQVVQLLNMGADFASVAKKYSEGPNAAEGGDIGFVERGTMAKVIDDVIFNMKAGQVSRPIKTPIGFAIIKVNSARNEQYRPVEDVKNEIEETLLDEAAKSVLGKWVAELKAKAFISVKE